MRQWQVKSWIEGRDRISLIGREDKKFVLCRNAEVVEESSSAEELDRKFGRDGDSRVNQLVKDLVCAKSHGDLQKLTETVESEGFYFRRQKTSERVLSFDMMDGDAVMFNGEHGGPKSVCSVRNLCLLVRVSF